MKKAIEAIGIISGLITIIEWVKNWISGTNLFSPLGIGCLSTCIFCLFLLVLFYRKKTRYTIYNVNFLIFSHSKSHYSL